MIYRVSQYLSISAAVIFTDDIVNSYKFAMADASATTTCLRFLLLVFLSLNFSTGPGITDWIMPSCLGVIVSFSREKFVKPILNDSDIRTTFSLYYSSTGNYTACSVWSILIFPPFTHPTRLMSSGWAFFPFVYYSFSRPKYTEQRYWLIGGVIWIVERILREVRSRLTLTRQP